MTSEPTITGYHAHIYYDADSRDEAARLRRAIAARFDTVPGRWRDAPVGPHPTSMYQVVFATEDFAEIVPWLATHRGGLSVLVHPCTGNELADHSDYAIWLGDSIPLRLDTLAA